MRIREPIDEPVCVVLCSKGSRTVVKGEASVVELISKEFVIVDDPIPIAVVEGNLQIGDQVHIHVELNRQLIGKSQRIPWAADQERRKQLSRAIVDPKSPNKRQRVRPPRW